MKPETRFNRATIGFVCACLGFMMMGAGCDQLPSDSGQQVAVPVRDEGGVVDAGVPDIAQR
jgi:hypothetical protein